MLLAVLVLGGFWVYKVLFLDNGIKNLSDLPSCDFYRVDNPAVVDMINTACDLESQVGDDDEARLKYLNAALAWKSAADALPVEQRADLNRRAVDVYRFYEQKFDDHAYSLRWNIAHLYQDLGDYNLAEEYYLKAIESNNINAEPYIALYYLYDKGNIEKNTAEIDQYFADALKLVSENRDQLLHQYLTFLEKNNLTDKAAEVRAELKVRYPELY